VFRATSTKAYRFCQQLTPLPAKSLLEQKFRTLIHFDKSRSIDECGIPPIVDQWRQCSGLGRDCLIDAGLVFDAAVFKPSDVTGFGKCNHAFVFMVQPEYPNFKNFVVYVRPHPQGSLGKEDECYFLHLAQILQRSHIQILTFATDGDRGHLAYQQAVFSNYRKVLDNDLESICEHCFQAQADPIGGAVRTIWWVVDPLHCFKCQRCRLQGNLSLCPGGPVLDVALLNATLNLRHCLTDLRGANKMNDIFAIRLFSVDNLLTLVMKEHLNVSVT
jgi:hypothetical protein